MKTFDGFVKFLADSMGEGGAQIAFETYTAGAPHQEKANLAALIREKGIDLTPPSAPTAPEVAKALVADKVSEAEKQLAADLALKATLTAHPQPPSKE